MNHLLKLIQVVVMQLVKQKNILNFLKENKILFTSFFIIITTGLFYIFLKFQEQQNIRCIIISILFIIFCALVYINNILNINKIKEKESEYRDEINIINKRFEKQLEKIKNEYLFKVSKNQKYAEFGKISSELFHEIANPLTSLNLNIEGFKKQLSYVPELKQFRENLEHATLTAKKIAEMISVIRKQISDDSSEKYFLVNKEIEDAIELIKFKSFKKRVMLDFYANEEIEVYGRSTNFFRVCLNIICNAIDAYQNFNPWLADCRMDKRIVNISVYKMNDNIEILFKDYGRGIKNKNLNKIFTPFFSTKKPDKGTGIGLHLCKEIIEKEFKGKILVYSEHGKGSLFKIVI
jgi:signal transduction histidine kinase